MQPGDVYQTHADTQDLFKANWLYPKVGVKEKALRTSFVGIKNFIISDPMARDSYICQYELIIYLILERTLY